MNVTTNRQRITHEWSVLKGQIKEQWGKLTDDDLLAIAGQREQLLASIRWQYGLAADEAERQVEEWGNRVGLGTTRVDRDRHHRGSAAATTRGTRESHHARKRI